MNPETMTADEIEALVENYTHYVTEPLRLSKMQDEWIQAGKFMHSNSRDVFARRLVRLLRAVEHVRNGMPGYQSTEEHERRMLTDATYRLMIHRLAAALEPTS